MQILHGESVHEVEASVGFVGTPEDRGTDGLAHGLGHQELKTFGTQKFSLDGPLCIS